MIFYPHQKKMTWESERCFADLMLSHGYSLIYQPRIYIPGMKRNFSDNAFLAPDFFCFETNCYYEVINTPSGFEWRKPDILAAILMGFRIKILTPSGTPYIFRCYQRDLHSIIDRLGSKYFSLFLNKTEKEKPTLIQDMIAQAIGVPMDLLWSPLEKPKIGLTKEERRIKRINESTIARWLHSVT